MASKKKTVETEREWTVAFLREKARDAARRAEAWRFRGREDMAVRKEWEAQCAGEWASAVERGEA